jgi:hypothetical protein
MISPNRTLTELLEKVCCVDYTRADQKLVDICELVLMLDEHLSDNGELPIRWARE